MVNKKNTLPRKDNIRGLIQDVSELLDVRMAALNEGTPMASVRPSDAKTFMLAARHPRSIADIAKAMMVSRQAAHQSVQRLVERGVVDIQPVAGNRKEKNVIVNEAGHQIRRQVAQNLQKLEADLESAIGKSRLEQLRLILAEILED